MAGAAVLFWPRGARVARLGSDRFPQFSLVFDVTSSDQGKLISQRLDYTDMTHWRTTVLLSETDQTVKDASFVVDGDKLTWYDPSAEPSTRSATADGVVYDPAPFMKPRNWADVAKELPGKDGRRLFHREQHYDPCLAPEGTEIPTDGPIPTVVAEGVGGPGDTPKCGEIATSETIEVDSETGVPLSYVISSNGIETFRFTAISIEYR